PSSSLSRHSVVSLLACGSLPSKQGVPLILDADALDIVLKPLLPAHGILAPVIPIPEVRSTRTKSTPRLLNQEGNPYFEGRSRSVCNQLAWKAIEVG
ncbi:hypothetical protein BJ912DRAFT_1040947, partial [Pholiota molesta]